MRSAELRRLRRRPRRWSLTTDAVDRAAILLVDDDVLRRIDELAGQVTGIGGLERGIGQTLAGAVGGDEVFQHGEAFAEVRGDGALDDFAARAWP